MHHASQRGKKERERKLPPEEEPEFQIAPMIDILLVLLVFFMSISSTEVLQKTEGITLPVAADARDKDEKNPGQVIVNVMWSELTGAGTGSIIIDDKTYAKADDILPRLNAALKANPLVRVLIRGDKSVRYAYMREILKAVGTAGVNNVTFSVVNKDEPASSHGGAMKPGA